MCGIYGFVGALRDGDDRLLEAMDERLRHRGPDDTGVRFSTLGALGMRRLSIIDLERGHQPICDESGTIWVTLNGEIYNYRELRCELEDAGHRFTSDSDTEILAHAYESYGDDFVHRLRGMFAFALFDERHRRVVFARDRLGKKPLYFAKPGGRLIYASELKALLAAPEVSREINRIALWHFLTLKNVPAPLSIFRDVQQLLPGHLATYDCDSNELRTRRYWHPRVTADSPLSEEEAAEELLSHLREAVAIRVDAADVPVGAFLSGGVDSSLVVALMAERSSRPVKTFALGYATRVAHKNDLAYAREMSERFGTEHTELELSVDEVAGRLPEVVRCFDEPFAGTITAYWLSELIGKHVKVALSGDGADELFGSYADHRMAAAVDAFRCGRGLRTGQHFADRGTFVAECAAQRDATWRTRFCAFSDQEKRALLGSAFDDLEASGDLLESLYAESPGPDAVSRTLEVDSRTLLPDQILTYVDRLAMAHSLEVRVPFLDHRLVEFVGALPSSMKVTVSETKRLLKRAAAAYLPASVITRPKEGFVLPADAWLNSAFKPLLNEVFSPAWMRHGFFSKEAVDELLAAHLSGVADNTYKVWTLVMFQLWHRQYVDGAAYACVEPLHTEVA